MKKILIGATFGQAYGLTFGNLGLFVRVAAIPFILTIVMSLAVILLASANPPRWLGVAQNVLTFVIEVPLLTSWHRFTLLSRNQALPTMGFHFSPRELRFLGYLLLMMLTFAVPFLFIAPAARGAPGLVLVSFVFIVGMFYVWARLCPVFPAAAVGVPVRLGDAWRLTQGNGWRIFWLTILIGLPFAGIMMAVSLVMASIVATTKDPTVLAYGAVPMIIVSMLFAAVNAATQSIVFRDLTGYDPATFTPA